jgi:hypothetical protein
VSTEAVDTISEDWQPLGPTRCRAACGPGHEPILKVMDRPLHPNLARIAAAYDEVMDAYRRQQLSAAEARRRVLALVARDDNGLEWSINPDTGHWQYRSHFGELLTAEPPAYGVAGFTPTDLGAGRPDSGRVHLVEVDQEALRSHGTLAGSTLLTETTGRATTPRRLVALVAGVVAAVCGVAVAALLLL